MFDSDAITRVQSIILIAIFVLAALGGAITYMQLSKSTQQVETIKIGICADLDMPIGQATWQGAILAAEQINALGGILGRNVTIVAQDDSSEGSLDISAESNALTRLITVDKADYVITPQMVNTLVYQDICAEQKKILFGSYCTIENVTQRVIENYGRYKYFFRLFPANSSAVGFSFADSYMALARYTGFRKVGFIVQDTLVSKQLISVLDIILPKYGFDIVYKGLAPVKTTDFTSYFAGAEEAGAEIVIPLIGGSPGVSFVNEYYERQSPFVLWGNVLFASDSSFWNKTSGKCEYLSFVGNPVIAAYPLTNLTVSTGEAYLKRWGTSIPEHAVAPFDVVRYILPDAIKRAGTTEIEAVIKTLETVDVETSNARHFVFTASHDLVFRAEDSNNPAKDNMIMCVFQWQNARMVPVYPESIMKEAQGNYLYPPWEGPWSSK